LSHIIYIGDLCFEFRIPFKDFSISNNVTVNEDSFQTTPVFCWGRANPKPAECGEVADERLGVPPVHPERSDVEPIAVGLA
jgi:hypothetical protein